AASTDSGALIALRSASRLAGRRFLRGLLRGLLRRLLHGLPGDFPGCLLYCFLRSTLRFTLTAFTDCLLHRLLGRLLAEAPAHRLAGFLQQLRHFLQRQRRGLAILGDPAVELAVTDIRPVTAVQHLDVAAVEFLDDPV